MKIKNGYLLRNLADEWVIIPIGDPSVDFSGLMRISESGAFLWKMLEHGSERALMIDALLKEYEIDRDTVERELDDFIRSLVDLDLVVEVVE